MYLLGQSFIMCLYVYKIVSSSGNFIFVQKQEERY